MNKLAVFFDWSSEKVPPNNILGEVFMIIHIIIWYTPNRNLQRLTSRRIAILHPGNEVRNKKSQKSKPAGRTMEEMLSEKECASANAMNKNIY